MMQKRQELISTFISTLVFTMGFRAGSGVGRRLGFAARVAVSVAVSVAASVTVSCTDVSFSELDMNIEASSLAPDLIGGDQAGGDQAGDTSIAGVSPAAGEASGESIGAGADAGDDGWVAGDQFGLSPSASGESAPDMSIIPPCGSSICDPHAVCVSASEGPRCECEPRYEGDGVSCSPVSCPPHASGAPDCACDDGYEGSLTFDLATQEWGGRCLFINPCQLIAISQSSFIGTADRELGTTLREVCFADDSGVTRARFSLEGGEVYRYETRDDEPCEVINEDEPLISVASWPYSGGVLTDPNLWRIGELTYTSDACTYDVLMVSYDDHVEMIYLAPTGRTCASGDVREVQCGVGACQVSGEVVCEGGEWVDQCVPTSPLTGPDSCDGIDSDCDDVIDEDFTVEETSCGVGACSSDGVTSCSQGLVSDSCEPGSPSGLDDSCDGVDQDCDGEADESFITQLVSCGAGVCQADGAVSCRDGVEVTECTPAPPSGDDANCNALDEDCDGEVDEGYIGQAVRCGVGACIFDGFTRCINGVAEEECTPREPALDDATCDGVDDDCDGRVDEEYEPRPVSCGLGVCFNEGTTECIEGEERELCAPLEPRDDDRDCDLIDTDCDGRVDEAFERVSVLCSGAGVYACAVSAELQCDQGVVSLNCEAALAELNDESCDGLDDDCDGSLDEDYFSIEVSCGLGECADTSMSRCVDGEVIDRCLVRAPTGDDSDCDGRDDDCDGVVDESFTERVVSCGEGVCASTGLVRCVGGEQQSECIPSAPLNPDESACNAIDDDCDGRVDEAYSSQRNDCGFGVCSAIGSSSCSDGVESMNCDPLPPTGDDADCDGVDQDCDDQADESYPPQIDVCGTGVCYNTAASSCVDGAVQNNCVPLPVQGDDSRCDGIDQDCDGRIDEGYQPVPTTCTYGSVCIQDGLTACVGGQVQDVCDPPVFYTGSDNSCNLEDNDCDGRIDEAFVGGVYYCGNGVCRGSGFRSCVNGQEGGGDCTPNNNLASSDANCNGSDDDCDGRTDEHYGTYNVTCGRGVCARNGVESCSGGNVVSTCSPGNPQGDDSDTNGQDDDCDGRVDEDACSFVSNHDGCNGGDDDCDGRIDEDFSAYNGACGQGVCASTGLVTCNNGSEVSSCSPNNNNASADNNCDAVDDDCDGSSDEHYQGAFEPCGVGACKRNGFFICQGGNPTHDCSPGQPSPENTSNGVDDDCDGRIDEGAPPPTQCGNVDWYISPGRSTLNEFCCTNSTSCLSWAVQTSVRQPGNLPSSAFDEIVCKDGSPYGGRGSYYINSRGPYFYNGTGDFTYWQISPTGRVLDAGTWNCAGPGGGGSF